MRYIQGSLQSDDHMDHLLRIQTSDIHNARNTTRHRVSDVKLGIVDAQLLCRRIQIEAAITERNRISPLGDRHRQIGNHEERLIYNISPYWEQYTSLALPRLLLQWLPVRIPRRIKRRVFKSTSIASASDTYLLISLGFSLARERSRGRHLRSFSFASIRARARSILTDCMEVCSGTNRKKKEISGH